MFFLLFLNFFISLPFLFIAKDTDFEKSWDRKKRKNQNSNVFGDLVSNVVNAGLVDLPQSAIWLTTTLSPWQLRRGLHGFASLSMLIGAPKIGSASLICRFFRSENAAKSVSCLLDISM